MAYYLMVESKKGEYKKINISNSKYFQTVNRSFNKSCAYALDEIDRFTVMFNDENEMRERMVIEGCLSFNDFEKKLSIRNVRNGKYEKVPYGFVFQNDIEYLMEPERLIRQISKRCYEGDYALIKKIVNCFKNYRRCMSTCPEVNDAVNTSVREGLRCAYFDTIDENGDRLLDRFIKLIIFDSYDNYKEGKVIYTGKINYRNLHVLIALINYYDKENISKLEENNICNNLNSNIDTNNLDEEKETVNKKHTLCRKLGKKKYVLDDQMSFDI